MKRVSSDLISDDLLDAAEAVVGRQGIANLTMDAVAAEAGMSKGGVLHHFPSKDSLVQAMVTRSAENWRAIFTRAYELMPPGPGRMVRALLHHCLSDAKGWTRELQRGSSACFAALAQNPALIAPMRDVYSDLHQRLANDGLPPGLGETAGAAINGLWLYWVLGLLPVNQELIVKVRRALESVLAQSLAQSSAQSAVAQTLPQSSSASPARPPTPSRTGSPARPAAPSRTGSLRPPSAQRRPNSPSSKSTNKPTRAPARRAAARPARGLRP